MTKTQTFTEDQAREIKTRANAGEKGVDLAREFGCTPRTISDIKCGRTWSRLDQSETTKPNETI